MSPLLFDTTVDRLCDNIVLILFVFLLSYMNAKLQLMLPTVNNYGCNKDYHGSFCIHPSVRSSLSSEAILFMGLMVHVGCAILLEEIFCNMPVEKLFLLRSFIHVPSFDVTKSRYYELEGCYTFSKSVFLVGRTYVRPT